MMNSKLKIFLGIFGIAVLVGVLGFAVWRVQSQKTTIILPKATGGAGQCLPPSQTHFECVNNSCVRKIGVGSNQGGCTTSGASCGGQTCSGTTPDLCGTACTNKQTDVNNCGACGTVCTTGKVCSSGVCATTCSGTTPDLCGTACTNKQTDNSNCGTCGNVCGASQACTSGQCSNSCRSGTLGELLIPDSQDPVGGVTDVPLTTTLSWQMKTGICSTAATGISYELMLGTSSASLSTVNGCSGIKISTVGGGAGCSFGTGASNNLQPGTNYYWKVKATTSAETAFSQVRNFTTAGSSEANTCWGNGGANGKCYDCNGDGVINVLDFSCFRANYTKTPGT